MRGATLVDARDDVLALISIRAPLAGSDVVLRGSEGLPSAISIRAPLAGSDRVDLAVFDDLPISIRAPLAGSDTAADVGAHILLISIRAPLAGSDIIIHTRHAI